jgi:hypothetical protein
MNPIRVAMKTKGILVVLFVLAQAGGLMQIGPRRTAHPTTRGLPG